MLMAAEMASVNIWAAILNSWVIVACCCESTYIFMGNKTEIFSEEYDFEVTKRALYIQLSTNGAGSYSYYTTIQ
jgi:hypothetical protein